VPWSSRRHRFDVVSEVHLGYESTSGSRTQHHGYSVALRLRAGPAAGAVKLVTMKPLVVARARAEAAARMIGCRLHAEGIDGVVTADALDTPLTERRRRGREARSRSPRVRVERGPAGVRVVTSAPGPSGALWLGLSLYFGLLVGGVAFAIWASQRGSAPNVGLGPDELAVVAWAPLSLGLAASPLALTGPLVRATSRWTLTASVHGLALARRAFGLGRRRFWLPARDIEAIAVASDTEVGRHGRHQAVLCVTDDVIVAVGHGLGRDELMAVRDALDEGLRCPGGLATEVSAAR